MPIVMSKSKETKRRAKIPSNERFWKYSKLKRGWEKTMPQIEKPDDLQSVANLIRFFACMTISFHDVNSQKEAGGKFA